MLIVNKDELLRHQKMLVVTSLTLRTIIQLIVDSLVGIAAVKPQHTQLRHVIQLVGEVLCGRRVSVHVPVVGRVAEGEDPEVG